MIPDTLQFFERDYPDPVEIYRGDDQRTDYKSLKLKILVFVLREVSKLVEGMKLDELKMLFVPEGGQGVEWTLHLFFRGVQYQYVANYLVFGAWADMGFFKRPDVIELIVMVIGNSFADQIRHEIESRPL